MAVTTALYPTLWIGPAGSGKLTAARAALGVSGDVTPRLLTLEVGDYQARYWEFPTHMEIDILDLSMMDKQVLPEMLAQLLATREVAGGRRKILILRRIHGLSPAAAARLRAALEEYVWPANATAMVWATARVVNGVVASVMDGFVYRRVAGTERLDRRSLGIPTPDRVATVQSYIAEVLRQMVMALAEGPPCLEAVTWIRARVYELLGMMGTGAELVSSLTWATVRLAAAGSLSTETAKRILDMLAGVRWFPSYRTPLMLEQVLTDVYGAIAESSTPCVPVATPERIQLVA
jgi:hypothetical protein